MLEVWLGQCCTHCPLESIFFLTKTNVSKLDTVQTTYYYTFTWKPKIAMLGTLFFALSMANEALCISIVADC